MFKCIQLECHEEIKFAYRLLPRQKCSMIWNISTGFSIDPYSGSSDIIKSISTLAWIKSPSVERLTVPLIPIRQCSFVLWRTALLSKFLLCPGLSILVRIQHISSHRRKPHLRKQKRPISRPSLLPHQRKTKLRLAATSPMSSSIIWSQFHSSTLVAPQVLWYSSSGGSISITSNLQFRSFILYFKRSVFRYIGGVAVSDIKSSLSFISSRSFGYSSNLSAKPTSLIKFWGLWPVSMKCWQ